MHFKSTFVYWILSWVFLANFLGKALFHLQVYDEEVEKLDSTSFTANLQKQMLFMVFQTEISVRNVWLRKNMPQWGLWTNQASPCRVLRVERNPLAWHLPTDYLGYALSFSREAWACKHLYKKNTSSNSRFSLFLKTSNSTSALISLESAAPVPDSHQ